MNFNFQLGDHMVQAGFPSGNLSPAHMFTFKHLNVSLGLLCLRAFLHFHWFEEVFAWQGSAPFITELKIWLLLRTTHHCHTVTSFPFACVFVHDFTVRDGPFFLFFFLSFLIFPPLPLPVVLLCPSLPSYSRLRSSLISTFRKPVVCLSTTCTLFNPLLSLLTTDMFCLHITNACTEMTCWIIGRLCMWNHFFC